MVGLKGDEFKRNSVKLRVGSIRQKNDDSHAYIYPVGVSFSHKFMQTKKMSANVGVGTSLYLIDLYSKDANLDTGLKTGGGACVFVGTQLGKHVSLEASYNAITRMQGYDLSGLSLSGKILF
jgi:hypothetical protein